MNTNLRKELLNYLHDFEKKTIDISISSDNINPGGLFCLVDFLDSKQAYIFIINEVSKHEKKITLKSLIKITEQKWLELGCKQNITKPGIMRSNSLRFISGINSLVNRNKSIKIKSDKDTKIIKLQERIDILELEKLEYNEEKKKYEAEKQEYIIKYKAEKLEYIEAYEDEKLEYIEAYEAEKKEYIIKYEEEKIKIKESLKILYNSIL
tara:strand:- start:263 stop:889 length:627 start_codon:yes stop_codon:yes gene_type:complete